MANIFWLPNSPIKGQTIQTNDVPPGNGLPSFMGYGKYGGLSRFKVPLYEGVRDIYKRHPASIGNRPGVNIPVGEFKMMDISAKFIGNFIITCQAMDRLNNLIAGCTVDLFRTIDDVKILTTLSDSNGNVFFSLPNDSYEAYYMCGYSADGLLAGITLNNIRTLQQ
jgi:hypothetical protein